MPARCDKPLRPREPLAVESDLLVVGVFWCVDVAQGWGFSGTEAVGCRDEVAGEGCGEGAVPRSVFSASGGVGDCVVSGEDVGC